MVKESPATTAGLEESRLEYQPFTVRSHTSLLPEERRMVPGRMPGRDERSEPIRLSAHLRRPPLHDVDVRHGGEVEVDVAAGSEVEDDVAAVVLVSHYPPVGNVDQVAGLIVGH